MRTLISAAVVAAVFFGSAYMLVTVAKAVYNLAWGTVSVECSK